MKIYNGTSHTINFYIKTQVKHKGRQLVPEPGEFPLLSIPVQRQLSIKFDVSEDFMTVNNHEIPTKVRKVVSIDPLPEGYDIYIVSATFAYYCRDPRIRTVEGAVFNEAGSTIGCLSLREVRV